MREQTVIVGAGQAGVTLAAALREQGYEGGIRLIGAETHLPYQRPPLSKEFMAAGDQPPRLLRGADFYRDNDIDLLLGESATGLDLDRRRLVLDHGAGLSFTRLALATGGRPNRPSGTNIQGVHFLRGLDDARTLRERLEPQSRIAIVGGGFIGLELAATLSANGHEIVLLEAASRLMARAVSKPVSEYFRKLHQQWGVELRLNEKPVRWVSESGRLSGVVTSSGRRLPVRTAIVGVGIAPETELARAAGLACDDGIRVDEYLNAGPENVVAIGDCARFPQPHAGAYMRIESVQNATDQARCAASSLLGRGQPYTATPWFWSAQRDQRLQIAGLAAASDHDVVRGHPDEGRFSVLRYQGGRLAAMDSVNRPAEHMLARKLIARGVSPDPRAAADPGFDLKSLLQP